MISSDESLIGLRGFTRSVYRSTPCFALVQAPQDYRDGREDLFKRMCFWEYAGFFHLGMKTRDENNAIIQHGTMALIRRRALEEVGGWAEWCITEDAELGLRLFEAGYRAVYTEQQLRPGPHARQLRRLSQAALPLGLWRHADHEGAIGASCCPMAAAASPPRSAIISSPAGCPGSRMRSSFSSPASRCSGPRA